VRLPGPTRHAVAIGSATAPPRPEEVLEILRKTATSVAVNLLGVKLEDRPGYFAGLLPELLALRERTGRPHFVVVDEAHHMLPATWDPGATALPGGLKGFLFVTVRPEALSPRTLDCVDRVLAVVRRRGRHWRALPKRVAWRSRRGRRGSSAGRC